MIINLKLVKVNSKYCDYLREFDKRVVYNMNSKELRPFVGILFKIKNCEYFAPLSSPKLKHQKMKNTIDFLKIDNGKLGAVNFNNMIPVKSKNYENINLEMSNLKLGEKQYKKLLLNQLSWLNSNYIQVKNKSLKLYELYISNKLSDNIKNRCCDFKLLELKCSEYNRQK